jgi:hypothetical protein
MDLSALASLGKVAGLGGIALGVVALLVRPVIDRTSGVPAAQRAPLLRLVAMGAFGIGALGIVAWLVSGLSGAPNGNTIGTGAQSTTVTGASGGVTAGGNVVGSPVTNNGSPGGGAAPAATPAAPNGNTIGTGAQSTTVTGASGGVTAGGNVVGSPVTNNSSPASPAAPAAKP